MITKAEYEKKCLEFEEEMMYDGRGEYNGYVCQKCGYTVATLYKDKGVTPFVIKCTQCGGESIHRITSRTAPPEHPKTSKVKNWVRPTFEQFVKLSPAIQQHVFNGGLVWEEELK